MSLCGRIVVVEKTKRKRKRGNNDNDETDHDDDDDLNDDDVGEEEEGDDDDDDDGSINPLSYTYTNCDSIEILQEQEQQEQQQSFQSQQHLSFINVLPVITKGGELDHNNENDESTLGSLQELPKFHWLSWRMDPYKSFSDWIIDVIVPKPQGRLQQKQKRSRRKSTGTLNTNVSIQRYHVHRNILVLESQFFQSLFYNPSQQLKQAQPHSKDSKRAINNEYAAPILAKSNVTEITLSNEYEANVFPAFLDYMYNPSSSWITQQNAITMLLLSKHFGMKRLQWLAKHSFKQQHSSIPKNTSAGRQQNEQQAPNIIKRLSGAKVVSPKLSSFTEQVNNLRNPGVSIQNRNINHNNSNSNNDVTTTTSTSATATTTNFTIEVLDYDAANAPVASTLDEQLIDDNNNNNNLEPIPLSNIRNSTRQCSNPKYHHRHHHTSSINTGIERSNSLPTYTAQDSLYFDQTQQQQEPFYDQQYPQQYSATATAAATTTTNTTSAAASTSFGLYATATATSTSMTISSNSNNNSNNDRTYTKRTSLSKSVPDNLFPGDRNR